MTTVGTRLRHTAFVAVVCLVLTAGGAVSAPSALATTAPAVTDCFGHVLPLRVLYVPPGGGHFVGTAGNDVIIGTPQWDVIHGLAGDDIICAGDGEDAVFGDEGADDIHGERGTDRIYGGDGDDYLLGGLNTAGALFKEMIRGDDGNDYVGGESGEDALMCGNFATTGDPGDVADGGTGMPGSLPEDDSVDTPADCPVITNVP
jgi:hypothetical protein